jgi:hypothetical protein
LLWIAELSRPASVSFEGTIKEITMKQMLMLAWLCIPLLSLAGPASPQETERHRECAMDASGKTIDARAGSIRNCTGGESVQEPVSGSQEVQHAKRKVCASEAMNKPKEEREAYIDQCMRQKQPASSPIKK